MFSNIENSLEIFCQVAKEKDVEKAGKRGIWQDKQSVKSFAKDDTLHTCRRGDRDR